LALLVAASVLLIALGGAFHHHDAGAERDHDCSVCLAYHAGGQAVAAASPTVFAPSVCAVVETEGERAAWGAAPRGVARGPPTIA